MYDERAPEWKPSRSAKLTAEFAHVIREKRKTVWASKPEAGLPTVKRDPMTGSVVVEWTVTALAQDEMNDFIATLDRVFAQIMMHDR